MRILAVILNCSVFAVGGYAVGYYTGVNQPTVDQHAINEAVYQAMLGTLNETE